MAKLEDGKGNGNGDGKQATRHLGWTKSLKPNGRIDYAFDALDRAVVVCGGKSSPLFKGMLTGIAECIEKAGGAEKIIEAVNAAGGEFVLDVKIPKKK